MTSYKIFPQIVIDSRESSDNIVAVADDSFSFPIGDTMNRGKWYCIRAIDGAILTISGQWETTIDNPDNVKTYDSCKRASRYGMARIKAEQCKPTPGRLSEVGRIVRIDETRDIVAQCNQRAAMARIGL